MIGLSTHSASLNCAFGITAVALLNNQTELNDDGSIGKYSKAAFLGAPNSLKILLLDLSIESLILT